MGNLLVSLCKQVGLPAKSGVAGAILLVVPNVMGVCCFSPPLDAMGNSCRGVQFCEVKASFLSEFKTHLLCDVPSGQEHCHSISARCPMPHPVTSWGLRKAGGWCEGIARSLRDIALVVAQHTASCFCVDGFKA